MAPKVISSTSADGLVAGLLRRPPAARPTEASLDKAAADNTEIDHQAKADQPGKRHIAVGFTQLGNACSAAPASPR